MVVNKVLEVFGDSVRALAGRNLPMNKLWSSLHVTARSPVTELRRILTPSPPAVLATALLSSARRLPVEPACFPFSNPWKACRCLPDATVPGPALLSASPKGTRKSTFLGYATMQSC